MRTDDAVDLIEHLYNAARDHGANGLASVGPIADTAHAALRDARDAVQAMGDDIARLTAPPGDRGEVVAVNPRPSAVVIDVVTTRVLAAGGIIGQAAEDAISNWIADALESWGETVLAMARVPLVAGPSEAEGERGPRKPVEGWEIHEGIRRATLKVSRILVVSVRCEGLTWSWAVNGTIEGFRPDRESAMLAAEDDARAILTAGLAAIGGGK